MADETRDGEAPEAPQAPPTRMSSEAMKWALAAHLLAFTMFIGLPQFVGPLVVWLFKKSDDPYIDFHGKEAVNFNISFLIYMLVLGLLILTSTLVSWYSPMSWLPILAGAGWVLLPIVGLAWLVLVIVAAVKASDGHYYRYPMTIRFIS